MHKALMERLSTGTASMCVMRAKPHITRVMCAEMAYPEMPPPFQS